ncbi:MAG TPA: flagellar basal body-associated FliL family protein [Ignavibacteriales bacterium]|nr:flagellar basal body-associated FliL family protein [Ignavibacteriales bacterium]HOL81317.1 flagellar basal body-associated FliL family protein [Ignavibacteriales bacterium]HOM66027.1 flagellar basal body-associated FliL family protein [Ignavibacteriales bacterium]HPD67519.1 flagellar basal body-associated FliL family protein [Ignavibacteriales bacterium]HPP33427.1 flagellar basal body-associated FliL family protein [Ignavibacteriales bacterium]
MSKSLKYFFILLFTFSLLSCGGKEENSENKENEETTEQTTNEENNKEETKEKSKEGEGEQATNPEDENMFFVEDLVVNPYGTAGRKILLTSFAIELKKPAMKEELSQKKFLLNDLLIKVFGSKTLPQLTQPGIKDSLRIEIATEIRKSFPKVKVRNVYFSKFILQ